MTMKNKAIAMGGANAARMIQLALRYNERIIAEATEQPMSGNRNLALPKKSGARYEAPRRRKPSVIATADEKNGTRNFIAMPSSVRNAA
ncbi:MAG: hypothetical protein QM719_08520 [Thermomonas sp.]